MRTLFFPSQNFEGGGGESAGRRKGGVAETRSGGVYIGEELV